MKLPANRLPSFSIRAGELPDDEPRELLREATRPQWDGHGWSSRFHPGSLQVEWPALPPQ
ncbi:hypothetical protein D3C79_1020340 [compost metagenome]